MLYGALHLGATTVPLNPVLPSFQLRQIVEDADPVLVVDDPTAWRDHDGAAPPAAAGPDDLALLLYTSGSTATPRGVMCPHRTVRFAVAAVAARLGYRPDDVVFCRLPVSFDYGLYQLFLCAAAGSHLVFPTAQIETALLREARSSGTTVLPVVPALASVLAWSAERDATPTRVRLLTNTGAALTEAHAAAYAGHSQARRWYRCTG